MRASQRSLFDALKRADQFLSVTPLPRAMNPLPIGFGQQLNVLKESIATVDSLAADQQSGLPQMSTATRQALRTDLRHVHLLPLRTVARVLERTIAGMPHVVNVPRKSANEQALVSAAVTAVRDIAPYKELFIGKGVPENFVEQIEALIASIRGAEINATTVRARTVKATAGIRASLLRGRDALHCLDTIVRRCCEMELVSGPAVLADWESARRSHRTGALPPVASAAAPRITKAAA